MCRVARALLAACCTILLRQQPQWVLPWVGLQWNDPAEHQADSLQHLGHKLWRAGFQDLGLEGLGMLPGWLYARASVCV